LLFTLINDRARIFATEPATEAFLLNNPRQQKEKSKVKVYDCKLKGSQRAKDDPSDGQLRLDPKREEENELS
jgi:hypothetical protein